MSTTRAKTSGTYAKGRASRDRLVDATMRLVARNGSRGTTLAQIAAEAGVSQAAVMYHFTSKEELLNAALDRRDELERPAYRDAGKGLQIFDAIAAAVHQWSSRPDAVGMHSVLIAENIGGDGALRPRLHSHYERTVDELAEILRSAQDAAASRAEIDPRLKAVEIIAFINGLETAWLLNPTAPVAQAATQWAANQKLALAQRG